MLTRDDAKRLLDRALASCGGEAEAQLAGGRYALTRFANNGIHQNVAERDLLLRVRAVRGRRTAWAETNDLSDAGLADVAERARAAAAVLPEQDLLPLQGPQEYAASDALDAATPAAAPEAMADRVKAVIECARRKGATAFGYLSVGDGLYDEYGGQSPWALANSAGLFAYHASNRASFSATVTKDDGSGWVERDARRLADIPADRLAETAVEKALASRAPRAIEPGAYTVILEPAAVAGLLHFLMGAFNARAVKEGRSPISGRVGQAVAGKNVSLIDDFRHPLHRNRPWDEEGAPRRAVTLVDKGVAANLLYDRRTAAEEKKEPTGHGFRAPNLEGAMAGSLALQVHAPPAADLLAGVKRGILVTRFWYNRLVDPKRVIVTGMTRDGTFLVENGRVVCGVKNFRYNESVLGVLSRVVAAGEPILAEGVVAPGLVVDDFTFSSATRF